MKSLLLVGALAIPFLCSCALHTQISPKPNIQPVIVSNAATRKSIASSQTHIKKTQDTLKQQGSNLDIASRDLDQLLHK
jgi:hypothetical protein